ncbi:MAG: NeuD/PglB/VioB family sugar acetyltransferase [Candidatus Hodarchaeota archaeon]
MHAIIAAGSLGRMVASILQAQKRDIIGFYDDDESKKGTKIDGIEVKGTTEELLSIEEKPVVIIAIGIGNEELRKKIFAKFENSGFHFGTAIHQSAMIQNSDIGKNVIIKELALIEVRAIIGDNTEIGERANIGHDCVIGKHCSIGPGVNMAGKVLVGDKTMIGIGATIVEGTKIGANCHIGAGAIITHDIPDNSSAIAVPPKIVTFKDK